MITINFRNQFAILSFFYFFFIFCFRFFVMKHQWNSFSLLFCDEDIRTTIKSNCVLFLLFCQLFYCFRYLRDRKFNEVLIKCRDCEFYSLLFIFFAIFFNWTLIIWRKSSLIMFDYWNKLYKFFCAHWLFFRNNWLILQRLWLNFLICRDA